jgi:hypothetical protein
MAALIINNVIDSSSQIKYNYLGTEEIFGYDITANYTIDISDTAFEIGDTVLIQGREAIEEAYRRQNVVARIGGDEFLNGKITNVSFGEGTLVGSETASITIEESRRLDSYVSSTFTKYIPNPHLLENFGENYIFGRNGNRYNYTRTINLKYKQSAGDTYLQDAKLFLTNYYFANRPSYGYQQDGISENAKVDKNYRGLLNETYDLLGLSVSLSEVFDSSFIDDSNKVSRDENQQTSIDEQGYLTKTFSFNLTSLRLDSQNVLSEAIKDIVDEVETANKSTLGTPFSIEKGITKDGNNASLTIKFSTNPKKSHDESTFYTVASAKVVKFTEFTLNIEYRSTGKNNQDRFKKAKAVWLSEQQTNLSRVVNLFHPSDLFEKNRTTNFMQSDGKITEVVVFTDDPSYKPTDDGILKFKIQRSKTHQIKRVTPLLDLKDKKGKVAVNDLLTVGKATISAQATASSTLGLFKAKDFLEGKTSQLNMEVDEDIIHITSDVYNLNLGDGVASRVINYIFI